MKKVIKIARLKRLCGEKSGAKKENDTMPD